MGYMKFVVFLVIPCAIAVGAFLCCWKESAPPSMVDGWWGRGPADPKSDSSIDVKPFHINVQNSTLSDLQHRLKNSRLPYSIKGTNFEYGFHSKYMKEIVEYWLNKYDWRSQEAVLNSMNQFTTNIEGIDVHFVRIIPSKFSGTIRPLLMVHGWPGSFWEFYKILPLLTNPIQNANDPEAIAFEVICPSIPGYGYSEPPHQPGFSIVDAARVFHKLMLRLGHNNFYVQGGDWGAAITAIMATAYPSNVLGIHTNMFMPKMDSVSGMLKQLVGGIFPSAVYTPAEIANRLSFTDMFGYLLKETGYMHLQGTKPDTVAFGLNDSPAGLAAYLLEKFSTWTHRDNRQCPDGCLTKFFTLDELLTNVMIYWTTETIASSMRFYKESFGSAQVLRWMGAPIAVPAGIAAFPQEFPGQAHCLANVQFRNLVQYTDMPRGGHFAALQEPQLLARDIISFVQIAEKSVKSKPEEIIGAPDL